jgi:osmotically-inducible protein OsmY
MTQNLLKTDHELKTAIVDELAWTPSVNADRIGVSLDAGAVTLSGQVETYPEKDVAVRAVTRVAGVTAVADEIVVKNDRAPRDDADIAREASDALNRMVHVPTDAVRAIVHNQIVTLSGTVVWQYQREITQRAVAALPGVNGVINKMTLKPKVSITPDQAKARITAALVRSARFDARQIDVAITGSQIELTGTVSSWSEFRQAAHVAWATPGVTLVDNQLTVTP